MEWAVWLIIAVLVIIILIESIITFIYYSNYTDCANNVSPYCPQYTCPTTGIAPTVAGQESLSYSDCVSQQLCTPGLTAPCSLAATQ